MDCLLKGGGKHCFSLVIYAFCGNNALYSVSLPFKMLIFSTLFNTLIPENIFSNQILS